MQNNPFLYFINLNHAFPLNNCTIVFWGAKLIFTANFQLNVNGSTKYLLQIMSAGRPKNEDEDVQIF